jgi:hypothetical protein
VRRLSRSRSTLGIVWNLLFNNHVRFDDVRPDWRTGLPRHCRARRLAHFHIGETELASTGYCRVRGGQSYWPVGQQGNSGSRPNRAAVNRIDQGFKLRQEVNLTRRRLPWSTFPGGR